MIHVSGWIDILVHHEYFDLRSGEFGLHVMDTLPATNSTMYRYVFLTYIYADKYNLWTLLNYMVNIMFVCFYISLVMRYVSSDLIILEWKSIVVNHMCVGTHLNTYLHVIGLTNVVRVMDVLLF